MAIAKRLVLFLSVNFAVMLTITFVLSLLGMDRYLTAYGINYSQLAMFCFGYGMLGSFISLMISRKMAKWTMRVQVIDPNAPGELGELVRTVHNLARAAHLPAMPEVGIYESPEVNAFATGPTKARSIVAVSSGLLRTMDKSEVEGVLAHEISHVANGDMVTLTLIQGVVNAFVMFLSRIAAFFLANAMSSRDDREGSRPNSGIYFMTQFMFEIVFALVGMIIVAHFSRWREFRADAGGASLAGREKMRGALQRLRSYAERVDPAHPNMQAFKINGGMSGLMRLFATHPPLEERIRRLDPMRA
ncbi:MAG TPA: protease HtpX [Bdellovibrionota bacterium]